MSDLFLLIAIILATLFLIIGILVVCRRWLLRRETLQHHRKSDESHGAQGLSA